MKRKLLGILAAAAMAATSLLALATPASANTAYSVVYGCGAGVRIQNGQSYGHDGYAAWATTNLGAMHVETGGCNGSSGGALVFGNIGIAVLVERTTFGGVTTCYYGLKSDTDGIVTLDVHNGTAGVAGGVCQSRNYPAGLTKVSTSVTGYNQGTPVTKTNFITH